MNKMKKTALGLACVCALGACGLTGCKKDKTEIFVYMPDGAPALALAGAMAGDTDDDGVSYRVVDASSVTARVSYQDQAQNADICVLPLNSATKILGDGEAYQMLGAVTHGNLFLVSKKGETQYTADNLNALKGKTVGVLQLDKVPGLTLKTVLKKHGLEFYEGEQTQTDKVRLVALSSAQDMAVTEADCFLLAEPAVSAQAKNGYQIVGDLQALYGGENGYPQAVLVAKKSLILQDEAWVRAFIDTVKTSVQWLETASGAQIVSAVESHLEDMNYATSLKAQILDIEGVKARCGVRFEQSLDCAMRASEYLALAKTVNEKLAVLPDGNFYCMINFGK